MVDEELKFYTNLFIQEIGTGLYQSLTSYCSVLIQLIIMFLKVN